MYLTFQDYSKLNEWLDKYQSEHKDVLDFKVTTSTTVCRVNVKFKEENNFILYADLYIGDHNPFIMYNYNKFKEDMDLIIIQEIMKNNVYYGK